MQLKIQRSQRAGGLTASTIFFCLDVRADYTEEERSNINRYKLGGQTIYNSRAAQKYFDQTDIHLSRTQEGSAGNRLVGLAKGAASLAMAKMQLNITIASLGRGQHIECKDLGELLESEDTVRNACKELTKYLAIAATFDGSETVIEYIKGEEQEHITAHAPPLLEYASATGATAVAAVGGSTDEYEPLGVVFGRKLVEFWNDPGSRKLILWSLGIVGILVLLRSCLG